MAEEPKYPRGYHPNQLAALKKSWSRENCAAGGYNSAKTKRKQKVMAARIEDIRETCAAVAFTKVKSFNPETQQEEMISAYAALIKKLYDIGMNGNVQAIKLFTELLFYTPENQKALINIETAVHAAMPANIDDFETLKKLRKSLLFADGIEDAEVVDAKQDDNDNSADPGMAAEEQGQGQNPA